jgi:hypothetical protein
MIGKTIKTKCPIYAGRQKRQAVNLHRLPTGSEGVIRGYDQYVNFGGLRCAMEVCLVKFVIEGKRYFAELAPTTFELQE